MKILKNYPAPPPEIKTDLLALDIWETFTEIFVGNGQLMDIHLEWLKYLCLAIASVKNQQIIKSFDYLVKAKESARENGFDPNEIIIQKIPGSFNIN